jgi:hypothetical protein
MLPGKQQLLGKGTAFRECEVIVPHIQPRLQQEIPTPNHLSHWNRFHGANFVSERLRGPFRFILPI